MPNSNLYKQLLRSVIFIFVLVCTDDLNGQNKEFNTLKEIKGNSKYISQALKYATEFTLASDFITAKQFIEKAEDKALISGGENAVLVVKSNAIQLLTECCYQTSAVKDYLYEEIKYIITNDPKGVFKNGIFDVAKIIVKKEEDPKVKNRYLNLLRGYLGAAPLEFLESATIIERESKQLQSEYKQVKETSEILESEVSLLSTQSDSMSLLIGLQNQKLENARIQMELDSVNTLMQKQELAKQQEVIAIKEASNQRMRIAIGVIILFLVLLGYLFYKTLQFNKQIKEEKARSEELLLNILPKDVADELKTNGKVETKFYEKGTVMFLDFVGFSHIAKNNSPQQLVDDLNTCFVKIDELATKYGIEKIKTIGDAYMCVSGVPEESDAAIDNMIQFGKAILSFLETWNKERKLEGKLPFEARIGIHTGPIAAGVVGKNKFCYDIWGNSVNVAARLESKAQPGRICVSASTKEMMKDKHALQPQGTVEIKNMDPMEIYFLA